MNPPFPTIPGYKILSKIGEGSVGTVYRARQMALDRVVAIKVLHPKFAAEGHHLQRLQREARLTAQLDHPHVVKGIDFGSADDVNYFVMEFAPGQSLKEHLREHGCLPENEAIELAIQIAGALEQAYRNGIVHRDVKPGNIMITPEGVAKLTDLGLARRPDDPTITHEGGTVGTPHYISPEQARNPTEVDIRSDIYSLGATLYHAAAGRPPFAGESLADLITKVLFEKAELPSSVNTLISEGYSLVLRKMLAKDPAYRYQTPAELILDLNRLKEHRLPLISEGSLREEVSKSKVWFVAGGLAAVAVAAIFLLPDRPGEIQAGSPLVSAGTSFSMEGIASDTPWTDLLRRSRELEESFLSGTLSSQEQEKLQEARKKLEGLLKKGLQGLEFQIQTQISTLASEKKFLQLHSFKETRYREIFRNTLNCAPEEALRESAGFRTSWNSILQKYDAKIDGTFKAGAQSFSEEFSIFWIQEQVQISKLAGEQRYLTALRQAESSPARFKTSNRTALSDFPPTTEPHSAILRKQIQDLVEPLIRRIQEDSKELVEAVLPDLESAKKSLEQQLALGRVLSVGKSFDEEVQRTLSRRRIHLEELVSDSGIVLSRAISMARADLVAKEASFQREAAIHVLKNLDQEFAPRLKNRDYRGIFEEWQRLAVKERLHPIAEEIRVRMREVQLLMELRERFKSSINRRLGETIQIREGSIVKSGKLIEGFQMESGNFTLRRPDDVLILSSYASIHPETVGIFVGILDAEGKEEKTDLSKEDLYAWAVFQFFEGHFSRSKQLLQRVAGIYDEAHSLFVRAEEEEKAARFAHLALEKQAEDSWESARSFLLLADWDRAELKLQDLLREFASTRFVSERRFQIEAEIGQIALSRSAQQKEAGLRSLFPGAEILSLGEERLLLHYFFTGEAAEPFPSPEGWIRTPQGLRKKIRAQSQQDFLRSPVLGVQIPLSIKTPVKAQFVVEFPYEEGPPFFCSFSVADHNFGILSGGEADFGMVASWKKNALSPEKNFVHPGLGDSKEGLKFRFLRGGVYRVVIELRDRGREATLAVDGETIAQSKILSVSSGPIYPVEFRSWEPALVREIQIEGVEEPKK